MKALLLAAHGSRRAASNDEVLHLAAAVAAAVGPAFQWVEAGFLELADPDLPGAAARCIERGAREIVVVPYFLAAGSHVSADIPAVVDTLRRLHPGVRFTITAHVGAAPSMPALIASSAGADF